MTVPKVTLDTNILLEYLKDQDKKHVLENLITLAERGMVHLVVTARIRDDVPRPPLSKRLDDLPELHISETGTVGRVGYWVIGRDMVGNEQFRDYYPTAVELAKGRGTTPPDWRDWDHLHAHYLLKRDAFLTWDRGILCLSAELQEDFRVNVQPSEEYMLRFERP